MAREQGGNLSCAMAVDISPTGDEGAAGHDGPGPIDPAATGGGTGPPTPVPERTRLIVGIGASAGSMDAFKTFFSKMPADTGMAFVIIQHLDPDFESILPSIIANHTKMPVHAAADGVAAGPNTVHVIPPNAILTIRNGVIRLARPAPPPARRNSVNTFLASLAEDQGENAIGIILSGFGSDGALGIAAVKEHGGLTLSQAEFDHHAKRGMPQSAASGGFVDHVMSVEDMPQALVDYRHHRAICDSHKGPDGLREDLPGQLGTICAVLHGQLGRDFSNYKTGTLMRRIQRRMHVLQTDEVPEYVERLRTDPQEAEMLFRELLISVTRFFRDPDAFAALEAKVIPGLLAMDGADPIRVWVAGCATGEEAYSVAILLREAQARSGSRRAVQVFATDVDDRAVAAARTGLYLGSISGDMSAERLERYFVREDGSFRVSKDLREMCLFSTHDMVKDPPFSRIDLVCCRNLLIYFEPPLQQRVIATFHYALRSGGHLFLGPSESVASQAPLFAPLDQRHRRYVRRNAAASFPAGSMPRTPGGAAAVRRPVPPATDDIDQRAARAIARYAPAFLVVDRQHEIVRFSGQTAKYLEPAPGVASLHLFALLHADLRTAARAALREAAATGQRVIHERLGVEVGDRPEPLNLIVEPLSGAEEGLFVIVFQEAGPPAPAPTDAAAPGLHEGADADARAMGRELRTMKERLRTVTEELEAAQEELQSSNEEYLSVNEELQSANEELETSKEELQSLNEELQTINAELNNRNDSLVRSNSDLANLLDSTPVATLFLDRDLRIRRFTPRLLEIFSMREGDEGRPLSDIVTRLTRDGLEQDVQEVLRTLAPREREVMVADGLSYLMQVRPYRDLNNVIDGAVLTFVDISERKRHEHARSRLAAIVESSQDAIIGLDLHGAVASWNNGAERLFGLPAFKAISQSMPALLLQPLLWDWPDMLARLQNGEQLAMFEYAGAARDGRTIEASVTVSPVKEEDGRIAGASLVARNISERRAAERKALLLLGELDHRVKNILAIISAVITQTLKNTETPEDFAREVGSRVQAIAKAHSLLTQSGHGEVSLRTILRTELAPYGRGEGGLVIAGRDIALTPKASLALAMAIHELASNAAKYGALSVSSGRLTVKWEVATEAGASLLTLAWTETGGPVVSPPTRRGFGTTLIERALAYELDAKVSREFLAGGLRCAVSFPLTEDVGHLQPADDAEETA